MIEFNDYYGEKVLVLRGQASGNTTIVIRDEDFVKSHETTGDRTFPSISLTENQLNFMIAALKEFVEE